MVPVVRPGAPVLNPGVLPFPNPAWNPLLGVRYFPPTSLLLLLKFWEEEVDKNPVFRFWDANGDELKDDITGMDGEGVIMPESPEAGKDWDGDNPGKGLEVGKGCDVENCWCETKEFPGDVPERLGDWPQVVSRPKELPPKEDALPAIEEVFPKGVRLAMLKFGWEIELETPKLGFGGEKTSPTYKLMLYIFKSIN